MTRWQGMKGAKGLLLNAVPAMRHALASSATVLCYHERTRPGRPAHRQGHSFVRGNFPSWNGQEIVVNLPLVWSQALVGPLVWGSEVETQSPTFPEELRYFSLDFLSVGKGGSSA